MASRRAWKRWVGVGVLGLGLVGCGAPSTGEEVPPPTEVTAPPSTSPTSGTPPTPDTPPAGTEQPPAPAVCAPTGAGPYWLEEGEALTVPLRCGTGHTAAGLRFTVSPLPPGATVDEAAEIGRAHV